MIGTIAGMMLAVVFFMFLAKVAYLVWVGINDIFKM